MLIKFLGGGTGYCIKSEGGKEVYHKEYDHTLPDEIEHIYPDYSLYGIKDTAYGFMSRGCPRKCEFCHVKDKEGTVSRKVDNLNFWDGQKDIIINDPNTLACCEWEDILGQLAESKACVEFNQGIDIRMMTPKKAEMLGKLKIVKPHIAWDRYEDKDIILPKIREYLDLTNYKPKGHGLQCYVLVGDRERRVTEQDLERIYTLRELGISPYVMIYEKDKLKKGHELRKLQRWVNNRIVFWSTPTFDEYQKK